MTFEQAKQNLVIASELGARLPTDTEIEQALFLSQSYLAHEGSEQDSREWSAFLLVLAGLEAKRIQLGGKAGA